MSVHSQSIRNTIWNEIANNAFITGKSGPILDPSGNRNAWIFDIKGIILRPGNLDAISDLFWEHLKDNPEIQIGGIETAAIALVGGLVVKAQQQGLKLNAFYMRKSRKSYGLQRTIEGTLTEQPVVILDDILNSGKSIIQQIEVLKAEGKDVIEVCTIIAYRDPSFYEYFRERNIKIWSLFTLDDFPGTRGLIAPAPVHPPQSKDHFIAQWKFRSPHPRYEFILPKSAPVADRERVYFGSDNGTMIALQQEDGSVAWSHKTLYGSENKRIFSSPILHDGTLFFGAYDGNFYALDARTGMPKWINFDADWIGSSPAVAPDLNTVFIGLEFGLWKKHGGITALDTRTGKKKWWYQMDSYVHSSPAYSKRFTMVVIGSNSGEVCAFNAISGDLLWKFAQQGDVKGGLDIDEARGLVIFGSWDSFIYMIDARTGHLVRKIKTLEPIYSNPVIRNGKVYIGLLDKRVLCIDIDTGNVLWHYPTQGRVFATPEFINGYLFIGSNDGRLYKLDPATGKEVTFFQTTERIVNKVAHNPETGRIFLPTYANEMYCIIETNVRTATN